MVLPLLLMAGLSAASTVVGAASANNAANKQVAAQREGIASQERMQQQMLDITEPSRVLGQNALADMAARAQKGFDPGQFEASPGYQFRLAQGQQGMDRRLAGMGMLNSGDAIKAASDYNQGMASSEFGNWWDRQYSQYGMDTNALAQIANAGQGAQAQQIGAIQNTGDNITNARGNIGTAQANGAMGINNAIQGGLQNASGILGIADARGVFANMAKPQFGNPMQATGMGTRNMAGLY